ncbi:MAG TPA: DNA repair protein RadC [Candidatus Cloacimonadota bacterium]|nr:DNA repair protein RadC [Candidatus Cloacimonadota bacterium]HPT70946.1 DNA repair protein RadC [Candidatus Cloacimonadota bacterium]
MNEPKTLQLSEQEQRTKFQPGHRQRMLLRYLGEGLDNFTSQEVLELMLGMVLIRRDTKLLSKILIEEFGSLNNVLNASPDELEKISGISKRSIMFLRFFKDASIFCLREKILKEDCVTSLSDVLAYLQLRYKGEKKEEFRVLFLNNKNMIQRDECISTGTVNEAKIYIRELMELVFHYGSSAIMLIHNHPSGTMKPSQDDLQITRKIKQAMDYVNVRVLDHVIVGDNAYFSFAEENLL